MTHPIIETAQIQAFAADTGTVRYAQVTGPGERHIVALVQDDAHAAGGSSLVVWPRPGLRIEMAAPGGAGPGLVLDQEHTSTGMLDTLTVAVPVDVLGCAVADGSYDATQDPFLTTLVSGDGERQASVAVARGFRDGERIVTVQSLCGRRVSVAAYGGGDVSRVGSRFLALETLAQREGELIKLWVSPQMFTGRS